VDLFSGFKSAADTLEDATVVVADVFHLVRLALQALDEVRRRRQQQIHGHRGHKDDPLFRLRRVLRVARNASTRPPWPRSSTGSVPPTPTTRSAPPGSRWTCSAASTRPPTATPPTGGWSPSTSGPSTSTSTSSPGSPPPSTRWQDEVLAFFDTRATNAATESANVKIKSIRRAARGFRNPGNYAARIRLHAGQPRRLPTTTRIRSYTLTTAA
jgi:transposase